MKIRLAARMGMALAVTFAAAIAGAQGPDVGPGGLGFGRHRPARDCA